MNNKDTSLEVAIGDLNGEVIITFSRSIQWWPLEPESARQIAEQIGRSSYKAKYGKDIDPTKSAITDTIREVLQNRATHIIRSMMSDNKPPKHIASEVVDQILKEIT